MLEEIHSEIVVLLEQRRDLDRRFEFLEQVRVSVINSLRSQPVEPEEYSSAEILHCK